MSRRVDGILARLFAVGLVVAPLGILFAPGEKGFFWVLLVAIPLLKSGRALAALRREFTGDRATEFLGWLAIAGLVVALYAAAHRLSPSLVRALRPAAGDFVLSQFRLEIATPDGVDPDALVFLEGPPFEAGPLREWIVYGLSRAEAEGCARERAKAIKERARAQLSAGNGGGATAGLYREIAQLVRELGERPSRACADALRACVVPLLAPELEGTLSLRPLPDGGVQVSAETSPLTRASPRGRIEGRLPRSALTSERVLVEARIEDAKGSLLPGILATGGEITLALGPAGPQWLELAREGRVLVRAQVRPRR